MLSLTNSAILLDIGDTLIAASRIAQCTLFTTVSCFKTQGLLARDADLVDSFRIANQKIEGHAVNHLFSSEQIVELACSLAGIEPSREFVERFLAGYQDSVREQLLPDHALRALLQSLKDSGVLIGVVTDGTTNEQTETLQRIGVLSLIDVVVTSEQLGVEKPHAIMFTTALDRSS